MKRCFFLILLLFALITGCTQNTTADWTIPHSLNNSGDILSEGLYLVHSDGSAPSPIINLPDTRVYSHPTYSPDGRYLAFLRNNGENSDSGLYILDMYEKNPQPQHLTDFGSHYIAFSPDGTKVLLYDRNFEKDVPHDEFGIYDLSSGTLNIHSIPNKMGDWVFSWSPDGTAVTFIATSPVDGDAIYAYDLESDQMNTLITFTTNEYIYTSYWAGDDRIYYSYGNTSSSDWEVRSIDPNNPTAPPQSHFVGIIYDMALSPDSQKIVIVNQLERSTASLARADFWSFLIEKNPTDSLAVREFLWDQYSNSAPHYNAIIILDLPTGRQYQVSDNIKWQQGNIYFGIFWSPDSTQVAYMIQQPQEYSMPSVTVYPVP